MVTRYKKTVNIERYSNDWCAMHHNQSARYL